MNTTDDNSKYDEQMLMGLDLSLMFQIEDKPQEGIKWKDENGKTTYDESKVRSKETIQIPQWKYPESDEEFRLIFEREFNKHKELKDRSIFKEVQIEVIESKLTEFKGNNPEGMDPELYEIARKYLNFLKPNEDRIKKWKPLYDELFDNGYISCRFETFGHAMENHRLPKGEPKIIWKTRKSNAMYFADAFNFKLSEFNKCFIQKDGKTLHPKNRTQSTPTKPLPTIIKRYL